MRSVLVSTLAVLILHPCMDAAKGHEPTAEMVLAAGRFLDSLTAEQRAVARLGLDDNERTDWQFVPDKFIKPDGARSGLALRDMTPAQRLLAHGFVATALTQRGYLSAMAIAALEQTLSEIENGNPIRDPRLYYVTVFGAPGAELWAWRFEGHHLSINLTIANGEVVAATPAFFGANPAIASTSDGARIEALPLVQSLARELAQSFTTQQREVAVIAATAPDEILTGWRQAVEEADFSPAIGIAHGDLDVTQQTLLERLVRAHRRRFRDGVLDDGVDAVRRGGHFAWAGGMAPGDGHYYRIQTADWLIEYDNTQNDANHIHSVIRHFDGDFGRDVLGEHLSKQH